MSSGLKTKEELILKPVRIQSFVPYEVADEIQKLAKEHGISVSSITSTFIVDGVRGLKSDAVAALVLPPLAKSVRAEFAALSHRLSKLMARTAIEATTGRLLLRALLREMKGQAVGDEANARAWRAAVESLKTQMEEVFEVARALEVVEN